MYDLISIEKTQVNSNKILNLTYQPGLESVNKTQFGQGEAKSILSFRNNSKYKLYTYFW